MLHGSALTHVYSHIFHALLATSPCATEQTAIAALKMMTLPNIRQFNGKIMLSQKQIECLRACNECAAACLQCATACLKEGDPKPMVRCIGLDLECADICGLAARSIASGGEHMKAVLSLCAKACETCADECAKHAMDHCKRCADACKSCAVACHALAH